MRGSAGGFFSPNIKSDTLELFAHDFCRTITFVTNRDVTFYEKLPGVIYELPVNTFANGSTYQPNWCFENNLPSGLHNSTYCKEEKTPLFMSFPHFYGADPFYINKFSPDSDLKPSKEKHGSNMLVLTVSCCYYDFLNPVLKCCSLTRNWGFQWN